MIKNVLNLQLENV